MASYPKKKKSSKRLKRGRMMAKHTSLTTAQKMKNIIIYNE